MELVRSALGDQAHHRPCGPTVFGRELIRDQTELLNDFRIVHHLLSPGNSRVVGVLTVNHEVVATRTSAICGEVGTTCKCLVSVVELADSRSAKGKSKN